MMGWRILAELSRLVMTVAALALVAVTFVAWQRDTWTTALACTIITAGALRRLYEVWHD